MFDAHRRKGEMDRDRHNLLLTGPPGIGKTTLIQTITARLARRRPVGFYTAEIREGGVRKGFTLVNFDGHRAVLAHVDHRGPHRVGKYVVDVGGFDRFLEAIEWPHSDTGLVVIDEIGKMECLSERFRAMVWRMLDSESTVIATVSRRGGGLIADVKRRPDVDVIELTTRNRDSLAGVIVERFS